MEAEEYIQEEIADGRTSWFDDPTWLAWSSIVVVAAVFFRFYDLALKPFHHDEGVNGYFLTKLFRDGVYQYDPANYHGPTLYYISLAFAKLFGFNTIAVRASVAVFGVLTVVLALFLKRYIGRIGSLAAAAFLALSPGMVYISRYFIHEMFFVFCSLAVVVAVVFFIEKRKAGPFAIGWMILVLFVCFLPSALNLATAISNENVYVLWSLRAVFLAVESVLVYFVIRMLISWDRGRPIYLMLASASVAMLFATKETAFITLGTMLIAAFSVWIWRPIASSDMFRKNLAAIVAAGHLMLLAAAAYYRENLIDGAKWFREFLIGDGHPKEYFVLYSLIVLAVIAFAAWIVFLVNIVRSNQTDLVEPVDLSFNGLTAGLGSRTDLLLMSAAVSTVFIYLSVLFFSSFFTYAEGVSKAFEAYAIWTKTGSKDHTQNGMFAYVKWGMKVETPILILSTLGALVALIRGKHKLAIFTAFWSFGLFAAYTIIPYKTPWLALSFYLPMCLVAGYGINEMAGVRNVVSKVMTGLLAGAAIIVLGYQAYDINFVRYDDEEMGYVYAHTKRQFLDMIKQIDHYAEKSGRGNDATIEIVSPDYWPMTWYVKDYAHANFNGQLVDASTAEMIVAKKGEQDVAVIQKYAAHYKFAGVYPLRPGVDLMLLVRRDLADKDAQELYKIPEYQSP